MVNKGLTAIIAGGGGVAIVFLVVIASGLLQPLSQDQEGFVMKDVVLTLRSVSIVSANDEKTVIEIAFEAFNPNRRSVVLESIQYNLYANETRIASSEIGERAQGFVTGTGKTFSMHSDFSMTLKDKVEVRKTERLAPIWNDIQKDEFLWRVTGTFVVTEPIRAGGKELDFDFTT